ncbi:MAG: hypothetical protein ACYTG0_38295 [Planctomycetota bacterium]|jgi:hypothetical protein
MLRMNVGLSRKVGEADSRSYAASAILEVELDPEMIDQPDRLAAHARRLFHLAGEAVEQGTKVRDAPNERRPLPGDPQHGGNHRGRRGRRATRAQIVAIHSLATRRGIDLDGLLRDRYRVCQLYELSVSEASELIGELQASGTPEGSKVSAAAD